MLCTYAKQFEVGSISVASTIDKMVYTPISNSFTGYDTCEFKVTNSKGEFVSGSITILHIGVEDGIFNKTITMYKGPHTGDYVYNGDDGYIVINFKNGVDYISKNKFATLGMTPVLGKRTIVFEKKAVGNNYGLFYTPSKGTIKSEIIPISIWDSVSNTRKVATLTIIDGDQ